jgi:hypothetical protein
MKNSQKLLIALMSFVSIGLLSMGMIQQGLADEQGQRIIKEKNLEFFFDEVNPEGNVDLKKIVEEELKTPIECHGEMVICQIKSVGFDIRITKEWVALDLSELNNLDYANTVPRLENPLDQLSESETVVMQETLARRGLLQYLDGGEVRERGFFGALTWLGLLRLGHVKGLSDEDPEFNQELVNDVNDLINNMANDENYVANRPLPQESELTPAEGDDLFDLWSYYQYIAKLAQNLDPVDQEPPTLNIGQDVTIDGFVNVERTK